MQFCPKLFNEINFEAASISPCCNVHALKIPSFEYHGGPVDMNAYTRYMQEVAEQLQTGGPICRGCPELRQLSRPGEWQMQFNAVSINMHRFFCNCKCVYCDLWNKKDKKPPYEIVTPLRSLYDNGFLGEKCVISWGGGEPTILPEFNQAAEWAASRKIWQLVHSNAIRFSKPLAELLRSYLGKVNISLDSSSSEIYTKVKGVDRYNAVIANIERYCVEGNPDNVQLKYIVFDQNNDINEINGFLGFCSRLGIKDIQFSFDFREINTQRLTQKSLIGAAFMRKKGSLMGLSVTPFYIDAPILAKIDAIEAAM